MRKTLKSIPTAKTSKRVKRLVAKQPRRHTSDALAVIDRITGNDPKLRSAIKEATANAKIAEMLYAARQSAGISQSELAKRIGTKQPVIARLEDASYDGHSLTMLQRIAAALGKKLEVRLT